MPQKPVRLAEILKANGVASQLELQLLNKLRDAGLPLGEAGQQIIPGRRFEFDRVWRAPYRVAVEVQGATFVKGGHSSGLGIERDTEKANLATLAGWRVLAVTKTQIKDGRAVTWIAQALGVSIDGHVSTRQGDGEEDRRRDGGARSLGRKHGPCLPSLDV